MLKKASYTRSVFNPSGSCMRLSGSILTLVTVLVLGTVIGIASTVLFLTGVQGAPLSRTAAQAEPDSAALTGM